MAFEARYQIYDDVCGHVEWANTKDEALSIAQRERDLHFEESRTWVDVKVFDRFAKAGAPELRQYVGGAWAVTGRKA